MAVIIKTPPFVTRGTIPFTSDALAVNGQLTTVNFGVARDAEGNIISCAASGGNLKIYVNDTPTIRAAINGNFYWLLFCPPYYNGTFVPLYGCSVGGTGTIAISTVSTPFLGNTTGGYFVLARPGYYIEATWSKWNPVTLAYDVKATTLHRIKLQLMSGNISAQGITRTFLSLDDDFAYNAINKADVYLSARARVRFREGWTVNGVQTISPGYGGVTSDFYVINAAKQLQQKYGVNMAENYPDWSNAQIKADIISDFKTPTYYPGLPWDVTFVYPETGNPNNLKRATELYRGNTQIGFKQSLIDKTQLGYLNRLTMRKPVGRNVTKVKIYLMNNWSNTTSFYVDQGYVTSGYVSP